ncbi:hypothetical protein ACFL59_02990 [Planctomycetota bacterium]
MRSLAVPALLVVSILCSSAAADTIYLKDGRTVQGTGEETADGLIVSHPLGSVFLPRNVIDRIVQQPFVFRSTAEDRRRSRLGDRRVVTPADRPVCFGYADDDVAMAAHAVKLRYVTGDPERAAQVVATHPALFHWNEASPIAAVQSRFDGKRLILTVTRRPGVEGAFCVAVPPATYGEAARIGPGRMQDLTLLRAPVIVVAADQGEACAGVPVACGSYGLGTPVSSTIYRLSGLEGGSPPARLMTALCAGADPVPPAEAQLAVWAVRNKITAVQFEERHRTFGSQLPVSRSHKGGAADLVRGSGLDPLAFPFFHGELSPKAD